jgi:hypothetical protein
MPRLQKLAEFDWCDPDFDFHTLREAKISDRTFPEGAWLVSASFAEPDINDPDAVNICPPLGSSRRVCKKNSN